MVGAATNCGAGEANSGGNADWHSVARGIGQLADLINETKVLGLHRVQYGGCGSPVQRIEDIGASLCSRLNDLSGKVDIATQALNRLVDTVERLIGGKAPIV